MPKSKDHVTQSAGINNKVSLLRDILRSPSLYVKNKTLCDALISQGSFAKLEGPLTIGDDHIQLTAMSLNTYKSCAAEYVTGGFSELDELRASALRAIKKTQENPARSADRSKNALVSYNEDLKRQLLLSKNCNLILLQVLSETRFAIDGIISSPSEHTRKIRADNAIKFILAASTLLPDEFRFPIGGTGSVESLDHWRTKNALPK